MTVAVTAATNAGTLRACLHSVEPRTYLKLGCALCALGIYGYYLIHSRLFSHLEIVCLGIAGLQVTASTRTLVSNRFSFHKSTESSQQRILSLSDKLDRLFELCLEYKNQSSSYDRCIDFFKTLSYSEVTECFRMKTPRKEWGGDDLNLKYVIPKELRCHLINQFYGDLEWLKAMFDGLQNEDEIIGIINDFREDSGLLPGAQNMLRVLREENRLVRMLGYANKANLEKLIPALSEREALEVISMFCDPVCFVLYPDKTPKESTLIREQKLYSCVESLAESTLNFILLERLERNESVDQSQKETEAWRRLHNVVEKIANLGTNENKVRAFRSVLEGMSFAIRCRSFESLTFQKNFINASLFKLEQWLGLFGFITLDKHLTPFIMKELCDLSLIVGPLPAFFFLKYKAYKQSDDNEECEQEFKRIVRFYFVLSRWMPLILPYMDTRQFHLFLEAFHFQELFTDPAKLKQDKKNSFEMLTTIYSLLPPDKQRFYFPGFTVKETNGELQLELYEEDHTIAPSEDSLQNPSFSNGDMILPIDIYKHIFSYLDLISLINCQRVSKKFNEYTQEKTLWLASRKNEFLDQPNEFQKIKEFVLKRAKQDFEFRKAVISGKELKFTMFDENQGNVRTLFCFDDLRFSGFSDGTITFGLINGPSTQQWHPHKTAVTSLVYADGKLFSGSLDKTIKVSQRNRDFRWECIQALKGHTDWVNSVIYANGLLFSASDDETIRVWKQNDKETWECIQILQDRGIISSLCYANGLLFSGSARGDIKVWEMNKTNNKFECIQTLKGHEGRVNSLFYENGLIFACGTNNQIQIWKFNVIIQRWWHFQILEGTGPINDVFYANNMLFSLNENGQIQVWMPDSSSKKWECRRILDDLCSKRSHALFYSNGRLIAGSANKIRVWG